MNYCALLASGSGTRAGKTFLPKQFIEVGGHPLIFYTLRTLVECDCFDKIYIGVLEKYIPLVQKIINETIDAVHLEQIEIVLGDEKRMGTFSNIIDTIMSQVSLGDDDYMCLADANRPLISVEMYKKCLYEARKYGIACPAYPVIDGVCRVNDSSIVEVPPKAGLYSFQTPECFRLSDYLQIIKKHPDADCLGASELFLKYGINPHVVEGDTQSFKVTTPIDFDLLETYLAKREMPEIKIIDTQQDYSWGYIEKIIRNGAGVALFGYSGAVGFVLKALKSIEVHPEFIIDNNPMKQGKIYNGIPIVSLDYVLGLKRDFNVIITAYKPQYIEKIGAQLCNARFITKEFVELFYPLGEEARKTVRTNLESVNAVYRLLKDEKSKRVYEAKINYIISKDPKLLIDVNDDCQYFDEDIIKLEGSGICIDGGAYDGKDAIVLKKINPDAKIVCFELDGINCQNIMRNIRDYPDIACVNAGLYNRNCTMIIENMGTMGTSINNNQGNGNAANAKEVQMVSLDEYFKDEKIAFIKMDIEGAEMDALLGAQRIIKQWKPQLAICIYHSIEDHWKIPLLIHQINPNYRLYIRHYHDRGIETVVYAV